MVPGGTRESVALSALTGSTTTTRWSPAGGRGRRAPHPDQRRRSPRRDGGDLGEAVPLVDRDVVRGRGLQVGAVAPGVGRAEAVPDESGGGAPAPCRGIGADHGQIPVR